MSMVWQYFTKSSPTEAICSVCLKQFKTGGGTTNLRAHLRYKHPSISFDIKGPTITKAESLTSDENVISINTLESLDTMVTENHIDTGTNVAAKPMKRKFIKLEKPINVPEKVYIREGKNNTTSPNYDQFDIIGKNVAYKLRDLSPEIALVAEKLISDILYESAMGNITKHSRINIFDSATDPLN